VRDGFIASANYEHSEIYQRAKVLAQTIYDDATTDKDFDEVMNQTWPTTPS
jgi:hypothetical protein